MTPAFRDSWATCDISDPGACINAVLQSHRSPHARFAGMNSILILLVQVIVVCKNEVSPISFITCRDASLICLIAMAVHCNRLLRSIQVPFAKIVGGRELRKDEGALFVFP